MLLGRCVICNACNLLKQQLWLHSSKCLEVQVQQKPSNFEEILKCYRLAFPTIPYLATFLRYLGLFGYVNDPTYNYHAVQTCSFFTLANSAKKITSGKPSDLLSSNMAAQLFSEPIRIYSPNPGK